MFLEGWQFLVLGILGLSTFLAYKSRAHDGLDVLFAFATILVALAFFEPFS